MNNSIYIADTSVPRHHSGESSSTSTSTVVADKLRTLLHSTVTDGVDYRRYFETADTECNGYISSRAFRSALKQVGAQDDSTCASSSSGSVLSKQDVEMLAHRFAATTAEAAAGDRHHGQQVSVFAVQIYIYIYLDIYMTCTYIHCCYYIELFCVCPFLHHCVVITVFSLLRVRC
jgi:hypothetical protein